MEKLEPIALTDEGYERLTHYDEVLGNIRRNNNRDYEHYNETCAKRIVNKILNELYDKTKIAYTYDEQLISMVANCISSITDEKDADFVNMKNKTFSIISGNISSEKVLQSQDVFESLNSIIGEFTNPTILNGVDPKQAENSTRKQVVGRIINAIVGKLQEDRIQISSLQGFIENTVDEEVQNYQIELNNYEKEHVYRLVFNATHELLEYVYNQAKPPIDSELSNLFK